MKKTTITALLLLLLATSCRQRRELVSYERSLDSIATLVSVTSGTLQGETWTQTVILRPDSLGQLVPVEATVTHTSTVQVQTQATADTATFSVQHTEDTEKDVQSAPVAPVLAATHPLDTFVGWLAFVSLLACFAVLSLDKLKSLWKSQR